MSKFKKKKGGDLPAISTASLPDIVFMLLFFFMVATVMRQNTLKIENRLLLVIITRFVVPPGENLVVKREVGAKPTLPPQR